MKHADPSLSVAERVDAACDRFESEWKAGRKPRIEDYVEVMPEPDRDLLRQALLAVERELKGRGAAETSVSRSSARSNSLANATVHHVGGVEGSPTSIGRFEIRGTLGSGAFGLVYRAHDPQLGREVAVKVPLDAAVSTEADRSRFLKEARAAATINHPNICQIHEVGEAEGRPYIVMALVPGQSLSDTIKARKEPLPTKQTALIIRKVALALAAAHDKGIVHRDLKPANIMFDRERKDIIVMDFGLARGPRFGDARGTQSGVIMGTPAYMSPEQASGGSKDVGPAGDIFSLGVILYELLTGTRPFTGTATEVIGQILHVEPEKPSQRRAGIDPRLESVCVKAMAKDPSARYASMKELAKALDAILREPKPATGSADTVKANKTHREGDASTGSTNMADVFAAMSMDRKQLRAETAAVVEAAIARHRTPRWVFVLVGLLIVGSMSALAGIIFFTRSDKVKVDLAIVLNDVDLSDKSLSFFLDDVEVAAEALANPVELKPGDHVFTVKRGKEIVKRMLLTVAGGKAPGIKVKEIPPAPTELPTNPIKQSPLDDLKAADIPEATLNRIYGGRANAPEELVAVYPNIGTDSRDDYHGFDLGRDGMVLASSQYPWDMIEMRNLASGKKFAEFGIKTPRGEPFFIWVRIAPDGRVFGVRKDQDLYAFGDRGGRLWNKPIRGNWSIPALSPDGSTLVIAAADKSDDNLYLLDTRTGRELTTWNDILAGPTCRLQFSPDGQTLAVMSASILKIVRVRDGKVTKTLPLPNAPGGPVFSRDGRLIYHSHNWKEPQDYFAETDLATDQTREFRLPPKGCKMVVANPVFPILVSCDSEKYLHFWDADLGPKQIPYMLSIGCPAEKYQFTPEGRYLVVGCDNGVFVFRLPVDHKVAEWKTRPKKAKAEQADDRNQGFVPLFNGKDLSGWNGLPNSWKLDGDDLVGRLPVAYERNSFLWTKSPYKNFELKFQVKLHTGTGNSGVQIRSRLVKEPGSGKSDLIAGPQVEIDAIRGLGGLYGERDGGWMKQAPVETVRRIYKPGEFNDYHVTVNGKRVRIVVNGSVLVDDDFPAMADDGLLAFQLHAGLRDDVTFRNVRIKELTPPTAQGFVPLFNGKDLIGWKTHPDQSGGWTVEGGYLTGRSSSSHHLFSDAGDYSDFHHRAECRTNHFGNSGIDFRTAFALRPQNVLKFPTEYEAQILHEFPRPDVPLNGSLRIPGKAHAKVETCTIKPDEWFTLEVIARGSRTPPGQSQT